MTGLMSELIHILRYTPQRWELQVREKKERKKKAEEFGDMYRICTQ